jgi:hypothetical protein
VPIQLALRSFLLRRDVAIGGLVLILSFWVFRHVPMRQGGGDSRYSMLLSENLLRHRDFTLDRYDLPRPDYRLEDLEGHRYYGFPPGTSILSIPYLIGMDLRGKSVVRVDGSYDQDEELALEARLAALLMASFAVIIYSSGRLLLPASWSLVVTVASAFGTQVFSTMSRAMWSDTWGVFLVGLAAFLLLRSAARNKPPNLALLATIEVWAYIVRPTNALVLVGTAGYLVLTMRRTWWPFLITAAAWLGLFVAYSWRHFHHLVPSYFAAGRLGFSVVSSALLGNLVSPSRGLLICVPLVIAVGLLLVRYRHTVRFRPLLALSLFQIAGHLVMLSGFAHWWGGHCFGARLTASLVPWIVVLEILAIDALREARSRSEPPADGPLFMALASVLVALSIGINSVGALCREASSWNVNPNIDETPGRLWSWRRPQFLAPFLEPTGPFLPLSVEGLRLGAEDSDRYLGLGWSGREGSSRWTDGSHATIRFALSRPGPGVVELDARPYLGGGKIGGQRLVVSMNGKPLQFMNIRQPDFTLYDIAVPADVPRSENSLRFGLPDASSPAVLEKTTDQRDLGLAVRTIRWRSLTTP